MPNNCTRCGKIESVFVKLDDKGICKSCNLEIWKENYTKEWENYKKEQGNGKVPEGIKAAGTEDNRDNHYSDDDQKNGSEMIWSAKQKEPVAAVNAVAKLIKTYAIINAFITLIIGIIAASSPEIYYSGMGFITFIGIVGMGIIGSFAIYAFGEIIDLLQGIKNNTSR